MKRYTCAWWWPPLNFLRWPLPLPPPFFVRPGLRFTFAFLWIFFSPPCAILAAEEDLRSAQSTGALLRSSNSSNCPGSGVHALCRSALSGNCQWL